MQGQIRTLALAAAISLSISLKAQFKASAEEGKKLYEANNCGSCHALDRKVVGPALRGVTDRRSEEWLIKWIRNNEAFRKSGDADANALYKEYGGAAMNIYENLSPNQVKHILEYIKTAPKPAPKAPVVSTDGEAVKADSNALYILIALIGIFIIVLIILGKVRNTLRRLAAEQDGTAGDEVKVSFIKGLLPEKLAKMNPTVLIVFTVVILGGIGFAWSYKFGITEVGVQKGYAPKQPIAFSHKLHAGEMKLDCKYCHIGVEESKSATIPSINICMNCHKGVQKASTAEGDGISPEIAKIYKALDYNPDAKNAAEAFGTDPKPIRWVRIHNLPDHAYFNHSQHVKVAGLACQTCHGPVEKMEVVQQWSSLQMGWCIDCHRNAGIDAANNNYYAALHEKAAKDLKNNKNKSQYFGPDGKVKITPAMNGGLECAKCHY
ncbi:MAG: c-type cytochrome [Bacteroidetes bacterium]|nr:c-type cytochrome [Bacteroidota bacterium]